MRELSMHILDIALNSVRAKAGEIEIYIGELVQKNRFEFSIKDNGPGIPDEIFKTIKDPFTTSRTLRKVGLGIPLLNDTCLLCGGNLQIQTQLNVGTTVEAWMVYDHIDRPPLGDIVATIVGLITSNETINIKYKHQYEDEIFEFETKEIQEVLGDISLTDMSIYVWMKEFMIENLNGLKT